MAKAIFNVFFKLINAIISVILYPINALVTGVFPDFAEMIATFNYVLDNYIGGGVAYFFSILPPTCRGIVLLYLTLLVAYYTVSASIHAILKIYTIIKNIKFW